jgi:HK97 family phage prohead protease
MPEKEIRQATAEQARDIDIANRRLTVIISTFDIDSYGTRIDQAGWDFETFRKNPVIPLAHDDRGRTGSNGLPVAKGLPDTLRVHNQQTYLTIEFPEEGVFPLADTVWELARGGFINAVSVGFEPLDWEDMEEEDAAGARVPVRVYRKQRLLEVSIVTIPSNSNALVQRARKLGREDEIETYRELASRIESFTDESEPIRWNRSLSRAFDVTHESISPAELQYDWVAKHIDCEVKEIFQNTFRIPSFRIGGVLSGLRHALMGSTLAEVRNLTWQGTELPPVHNVIQLNSRQSEDFLVDGIAFYRSSEGNFAYSVTPVWGGLQVNFFTHREAKEFNRRVVDEAWKFAREQNPLKGEAFALSGEFIRTTDETWDDCFLEEKNAKALSRVVERLNAKGKSTPNRGVLMLGPPGTGKTLSGRIIRNTLQDCSFVWVSTRDFYRGGGFEQAFELAREIAPSVLFFEDIDNWVAGNIDLLKTEMDGIARSSGVVTIMTTNFPERLPEALIDRPGRFHDVLNFNLPTDEKRAAMLRKWIDGVSDEDVQEAVKKTKGYSGAHVYELASFARNIHDSDGLSISDALREAVKKVEEQKDLITSIQLQGSNYRPRRQIENETNANGCILASTMPPTPSESEKYRRYFEQKQPVNKVASRAMEKFFKARGIEQPADEKEAFEQMEEIIEEEAKTPEEPETPETPVETPEEPETPVVEEPEPAPNPPVQEAPAPERKAFVQIPIDALPRLGETIRKACVEASVEASRRGVPAKDLGEVAKSAAQQFERTILSQSL